MAKITDNSPANEPREEEEEPASDLWSDEDARRFNEALDEGSAYAQARGHFSGDLESYLDDQECQCSDPELCDADEETLPPGKMELIFENSYIM